jgi:hypothetical protein
MTSVHLEDMFHAKMLQLYDEQRQVMRAPVRFLNMVQNNGGLEAARRLLASPSAGDGFVALWEVGRLDLSVEALVLQEPWRTLFTEEVLAVARERLEE